MQSWLETENPKRNFYHEFHVSSAGSLGAGSGDLLAEVGRRYDLLSERHAVVLEEDTAKSLSDDRIVIDAVSNVIK